MTDIPFMMFENIEMLTYSTEFGYNVHLRWLIITAYWEERYLE